MDTGFKAAIAAAGNKARLARVLGISRQAIDQWSKIPAERIIEIEQKLGVPREKLRPELYRK